MDLKANLKLLKDKLDSMATDSADTADRLMNSDRTGSAVDLTSAYELGKKAATEKASELVQNFIDRL